MCVCVCVCVCIQISFNIIDILFYFPPNTIKVIREFERIQKKICRHKVSIMFNEICINKEMLPIYIYIYIYIAQLSIEHFLLLPAVYGVFFFWPIDYVSVYFFQLVWQGWPFLFPIYIFFPPRQWFVVYFYLRITCDFFPYRKCYYSVSYLIYIYICVCVYVCVCVCVCVCVYRYKK